MSIDRLHVRLEKPNPVFESWLESWLIEAVHKNSRSQSKLREALESLKKFPLPLASGRDCAILKGFGKKLCDLIDDNINTNFAGQQAKALNSLYDRDVNQVVNSFRKHTSASTPQEKPKKLTKQQLKALADETERTRQVKMSPKNFRILLLVDTQETSGKNKRMLDHTRGYLESLRVEYEVRRLTVGDFIWIARDQEGNELVLPYIVERKRMDDLASSMRDGRFNEQKHRLKNCGIPNIIYLIEDYGDNEHLGLPLENLKQALINTLIHNNFAIEHTENHRRSMMFLKGYTHMLIKVFKEKTLFSCAKEDMKKVFDSNQRSVHLLKFKSLYDDSARNALLSVREVFVQQLLQLHSLSLEKALAIVSIYPTPRCLLDAFDNKEKLEDASKLLANIKCGQWERPLGDKISRILYNFYRSCFE